MPALQLAKLWDLLVSGSGSNKCLALVAFSGFGEFLPSREVLPRGTSSTSGRIRTGCFDG